MSNKELRDAILVRYRVCIKRRWFYIILVLIYIAMGIGAQLGYMHHEEDNPYIIIMGVFAVIGFVAISMLELTRHEKCQYLIPLSYFERKCYYFVGILLNFTITFIIALLFIGISLIIDKQYGFAVIKIFAMFGLPYFEVTALQKINMFKGRKKKDNPKSVYISYAVGIAIGLSFVAVFPALPYIIKTDWALALLIIGINLVALARVIYACVDIMRKNTDYENVKVKEMLAMKKLM